jgi:hypothetical protein
MEGIFEISANGSHWRGEEPDPIEMLLERLDDFSSRTLLEPGKVRYWGNFVELSAVFDVTVADGSEADRRLAPYFAHREYARVEEIWEKANENERYGFRFGLFPAWLQDWNLTREELAELIRKANEEEEA